MASEWAKASKVACVAVTAAVHLLFLVAFSWMLVEGLLLWSKVVTVSLRPGPGMMLHYATGWGMPVAIISSGLCGACTLCADRQYLHPGPCGDGHCIQRPPRHLHAEPAALPTAADQYPDMGPYIFLVCAAYNGEVQSTLQRMTEKKAVEAFTVHAGCGVDGVQGFRYCSHLGGSPFLLGARTPPTPLYRMEVI
ncbi:Adhesion G-protein coupled receptor D2 [Manis javanica]|nr:Adhesion G-protein coupled receptor D2 [Manis javanica]